MIADSAYPLSSCSQQTQKPALNKFKPVNSRGVALGVQITQWNHTAVHYCIERVIGAGQRLFRLRKSKNECLYENVLRTKDDISGQSIWSPARAKVTSWNLRRAVISSVTVTQAAFVLKHAAGGRYATTRPGECMRGSKVEHGTKRAVQP